MIILTVRIAQSTHGYPWLSLVILGYPWLSLVIPGYPWLSLVITGYPWLSLVISGYTWLAAIQIYVVLFAQLLSLHLQLSFAVAAR